MNKKLFSLLIALVSLTLTSLNAQTYEWTKTFGSSNFDLGWSITTDASGNIYIAGYFQDTVDFDPSSGVDIYTSNGGYDIFVQKLDANGNYLWTKTFGGSNSEVGRSITTDTSGNIYIAGYFKETVDFDPSSSVDIYTSNGSNDAFVQKLDANGNYLWTKTFGGTANEYAQSITMDASGNIYIAGYFQDTVDFDPSSGIDIYTSNGFYDAFVQKLDANGNYLWTKTFGGTSAEYAKSITTDALGNIYIAGYFQETVDFDPSSSVDIYTSNGGYDAFVQKMDANGNYLWTKTFGGTGYDYAQSITTDAANNIYITGSFSGLADFDPSSGVDTLSSNGDDDVFVQKLGANGNYQWTKTFGGTGLDYAYSIATDGANHVYTTGVFRDTVDFDPSSGVDTLSSNGFYDAFVQKMDANGNYQWTKTFGGTSSDRGQGLAIDNLDNVFVTGYYNSVVDFDPSSGVDTMTSNGSTDVFVMKLSSGISSLEDEKIANNLVTVFPNPAHLQLNLKADDLQIKQVSISDMSGKTLKTVNYTDQPIQINDLANGIYLLKIETNKGTSHKRFVKQ